MPTLDEVKAEIDAWFGSHIATGPIAHHTPAYNQAFKARMALKERIGRLFGEEHAPAPEPAADVEAAAQTEPEPEPTTDVEAEQENAK